MDYLNDMHELCEMLSRELVDAKDKIRGGKMSVSDLDYIDKLTHAIKSLKTSIAMVEAEDGYSGRYRGSYARGRNRRDMTGRYSRNYSRAEDDMNGMLDELRSMANDLPSDKQREVHNFIRKMED